VLYFLFPGPKESVEMRAMCMSASHLPFPKGVFLVALFLCLFMTQVHRYLPPFFPAASSKSFANLVRILL
jgi:hypothetical protein